jgi:hypothetical protein
VVPASKLLSNWYPTNEWRDAYITIPDNLNGCTVVAFTTSFGDAWPNVDDTDWAIEMRDGFNAVVADYQYVHAGGQRVYQENMSGPPFVLSKGFTLNIRYRNGITAWTLDSTSKGYSLTLIVV